jgi:serine/threonine-protein kinase
VGRLPFEGEAIGDLLVKICTAPLPVPTQWAPGIPPAFDAWFAKALQREPDQRFATATALADSLNAACGIAPRGAQATTEASGAHAVYSPNPSQAAGSWGYGTPGSGTQPSAGQVPAYSNPNPASLTASPFTTSGGLTKPTSKGPLIAAVIAGFLVLGIAIGVVAKVMSGGGNAAAVEPPATANTAPATAAIATTAPEPTAPPPAVTPANEPATVASAKPAESAASAPPAKTAAAGVRPRPPSGGGRPRVEPKTSDKTKSGTGSKPSIDVGY